jgi:hypothetical protein
VTDRYVAQDWDKAAAAMEDGGPVETVRQRARRAAKAKADARAALYPEPKRRMGRGAGKPEGRRTEVFGREEAPVREGNPGH